jgi:hypothetical protein
MNRVEIVIVVLGVVTACWGIANGNMLIGGIGGFIAGFAIGGRR